jgi:hypothetical protein
MAKPILCVDFDGVIHSYTSGWVDAQTIPDPPVPHALQWLAKVAEYFTVCIYSSRSNHTGAITAMERWLYRYAAEQWGAEKATEFCALISFPAHKPAAFLTIDDRAIMFDGHFDRLQPKDMLKFKPWNKK